MKLNLNTTESDYFNCSSTRKEVLSRFLVLNDKLVSTREFRNEYRDAAIKIFDEIDKPFSLDLHGFTKKTAEPALNEFYELCVKENIEKFNIIHGRGNVISELVTHQLTQKKTASKALFDVLWEPGHASVHFKSTLESKTWPKLGSTSARRNITTTTPSTPVRTPPTYSSPSSPSCTPTRSPAYRSNSNTVPVTRQKSSNSSRGFFTTLFDALNNIATAHDRETSRREEVVKRHQADIRKVANSIRIRFHNLLWLLGPAYILYLLNRVNNLLYYVATLIFVSISIIPLYYLLYTSSLESRLRKFLPKSIDEASLSKINVGGAFSKWNSLVGIIKTVFTFAFFGLVFRVGRSIYIEYGSNVYHLFHKWVDISQSIFHYIILR